MRILAVLLALGLAFPALAQSTAPAPAATTEAPPDNDATMVAPARAATPAPQAEAAQEADAAPAGTAQTGAAPAATEAQSTEGAAQPANPAPAATTAETQPAQATPATGTAATQPAEAAPATGTATAQPAEAVPAAATAETQPTGAAPATGPAEAQPEGPAPATAATEAQPAPEATTEAAPAPAPAPAPAAAEATAEGAPPAVASEAAAAPARKRTLNVGVLVDSPPFSAVTRYGSRTGFDIDFAGALCEVANFQCRHIPLTAEDMIPALLDRRIDAVLASPLVSPNNNTTVKYTDPYLRLAIRFVAPRSASRDLETGDSAVYGALIGTAQAAYLTTTYPRPGSVQLYPNTEGMWIDLALHRLDAVLAPAITARREFLSTPIGEPFRFVNPSGDRHEALSRLAVIAVREGDDTLRLALNQAIRDVLASQDFTDMINDHLDRGLATIPSATPTEGG
ncbi:transporter substrate-binding domain-containing protein [Acuticoccus kandeliae]|uniref:transporter substrate-binding domain-containing protein n=1 Tax=Acuticoccus kandeliae TaxID=2073160 RepID=UPI000D3E6B71|nr:transporter substrate-binding domain-containing protein [Acuticoccus kandeliae]